jgi:hypothetical protein
LINGGGNEMKKYMFIIIVTLFMALGLMGCYTELLTTNAALASDNSDNTTIIYYPVPVADPSPVPPQPGCPQPIHPQPVYSPKTPANNPGNQGDTKRSETTVRNDNGGRGSEPRNGLTTPSRTRTEPSNTSASNSSNNSNGNVAASANSGNNSASRTGNTTNNSPRNNNGSRNTNGGR